MKYSFRKLPLSQILKDACQKDQFFIAKFAGNWKTARLFENLESLRMKMLPTTTTNIGSFGMIK